MQAMREADESLRRQHAAGVFDDGDPNNPKYNGGYNYTTGRVETLFGYETQAFLAKQYR